MRIVIFGLSLSSSWGNGHATTYRSLVKGLAQCGHHVTFFERNEPWYAEHRDAQQFDYCLLHLYDSVEVLAKRHRGEIGSADAVIVGSCVPEGARLVDWLEGVVQGQLCFYDIDTPLTLERLARDDCEYLRADQVPRFDRYFSFSGGAALTRLAELGAHRPRALYCSVDTDLYRPPNGAEPGVPRWWLGYMGTFAADRQSRVEQLLLEAARRRPEQRFVVAGPGYPDTASWSGNVDWLPHVSPDLHRTFYGNQTFTLNATRAAMVAIGCSPSVRLFEAAACGCCIISDDWRGLEQVLEPGREILIAASTDEVLDLMEGMTAAQRDAIGRAARERVLAEHSHTQRAKYLVSCLVEGMDIQRAAP
jgi:spore maturation protein CgeB